MIVLLANEQAFVVAHGTRGWITAAPWATIGQLGSHRDGQCVNLSQYGTGVEFYSSIHHWRWPYVACGLSCSRHYIALLFSLRVSLFSLLPPPFSLLLPLFSLLPLHPYPIPEAKPAKPANGRHNLLRITLSLCRRADGCRVYVSSFFPLPMNFPLFPNAARIRDLTRPCSVVTEQLFVNRRMKAIWIILTLPRV